MLLLYRSSILYFYNWSLLMFFRGYTDRISSSDVVQGHPFWEPSDLQRRLLQVLGTGGSWHHRCHQVAHADVFREKPDAACAALDTNLQKLGSGWEKGPCTINCLMSPPVSSVDYYRLAQIWACISYLCRPLGGVAFLYWLTKVDASSCAHHINWLLK